MLWADESRFDDRNAQHQSQISRMASILETGHVETIDGIDPLVGMVSCRASSAQTKLSILRIDADTPRRCHEHLWCFGALVLTETPAMPTPMGGNIMPPTFQASCPPSQGPNTSSRESSTDSIDEFSADRITMAWACGLPGTATLAHARVNTPAFALSA
jgi:hypothetical protein